MISSLPCAELRKQVSKGEGGRYTPLSKACRNSSLNRSASVPTACSKLCTAFSAKKRQNIAPTCGTCKGMPAEAATTVNSRAKRLPISSRRGYGFSFCRIRRTVMPAAMARGLPLRVPAWYTGPNGAKWSMISLRPPNAPTGSPPPMIFPIAVRSGVTPSNSCTPPSATRKPVITSSKTSKEPWASH